MGGEGAWGGGGEGVSALAEGPLRTLTRVGLSGASPEEWKSALRRDADRIEQNLALVAERQQAEVLAIEARALETSSFRKKNK